MQNIVINMCEKFHYDRLRKDRALGNGKSDKNKNNNKNNVRSAWGPVSVSGSRRESEWVSSFLTALQHNIGYTVPYR